MVEETTFRRLKYALLELLRGYPEYMYWGKIESYLKSGKKGVEILNNHQIIEKIPLEEVKRKISEMTDEERKKLPLGEERFLWYRLAPKGVDLATSMISLDYSEKVLRYSHEAHRLNKNVVWLSRLILILTVILTAIGIIQVIPIISSWLS